MERLDEVVTLIDVVPVAGPPVIFVVGPWALFVLVLIGPFLLLVTFVLVVLLLAAVAAAILAPPYLLVQGHHKHLTRRPEGRTDAHRRRVRHPLDVRLLTQRSDTPLRNRRTAKPPARARHNRAETNLTSERM